MYGTAHAIVNHTTCSRNHHCIGSLHKIFLRFTIYFVKNLRALLIHLVGSVRLLAGMKIDNAFT